MSGNTVTPEMPRGTETSSGMSRNTVTEERHVEEQKKVEKVLQGRVVSNKMQKTIVVEIHQRKLHRLYKKYLTRTTKIKAHDEKNECGIGDTVRVVESRPLSRQKHWRLVEIVEKAK